MMKWGWALNTLINVRGEEILEKMLFRPYLLNRCVVLVEGVFEWDKDRNPYKYIIGEGKKLFIAAIYNKKNEVILLTNKATKKFEKIHHRMPMILDEEEIDFYLDRENDVIEVFKSISDHSSPKWG